MVETIRLYAGKRSNGSPVEEEVRVKGSGDGLFEVLQSPGLVLGIAGGDTIRVLTGGHFEVVSRGGNFCIQVFSTSRLDELEACLTECLGRLRGRLDGRATKELVYTVHSSVGFDHLEQELASCIGKVEGANWYYGNVYDPKDGTTPLNWWK